MRCYIYLGVHVTVDISFALAVVSAVEACQNFWIGRLHFHLALSCFHKWNNHAAAVFYYLLSLCLSNAKIEFLIKELIINWRQQHIPQIILLDTGVCSRMDPFCINISKYLISSLTDFNIMCWSYWGMWLKYFELFSVLKY